MRLFPQELYLHGSGKYPDYVYSVDSTVVSDGGTRSVLLVTGGADSIVRMWRVSNEYVLIWHADLEGHTLGVNCVRFSPTDPHTVATGSDDGRCIIWTRKKIGGSVSSAVPFGSRMETRSAQDQVDSGFRWVAGRTINCLDEVVHVSWSPCGTQVACAQAREVCVIYDVKNGRPLQRLDGHTSRVHGVAWDPLGDLIATCSSDRSMRVYGKSKKHHWYPKALVREFQDIERLGPLNSVKFFMSDSHYAVDPSVHFFRRLAFSPDGQLVLVPGGLAIPHDLLVSERGTGKDEVDFKKDETIKLKDETIKFKDETIKPKDETMKQEDETMKQDASSSLSLVYLKYAVHVFGRSDLHANTIPSASLPTPDGPCVAVRFYPLPFERVVKSNESGLLERTGLFERSGRSEKYYVFALFTAKSVWVYESTVGCDEAVAAGDIASVHRQSSCPFKLLSFISNVHATCIVDGCWAMDPLANKKSGEISLSIVSTDGYLTLVVFEPKELGGGTPVWFEPQASRSSDGMAQLGTKESQEANQSGLPIQSALSVQPALPIQSSLPIQSVLPTVSCLETGVSSSTGSHHGFALMEKTASLVHEEPRFVKEEAKAETARSIEPSARAIEPSAQDSAQIPGQKRARRVIATVVT